MTKHSILPKLILCVLLLDAVAVCRIRAQQEWLDPFLDLTAEADGLGVSFTKNGKSSFRVSIPESGRVPDNFSLGKFSIVGGGNHLSFAPLVQSDQMLELKLTQIFQ